ncbi:MAG: hypothetical protein H7833_02920 [Magnetococcus sp. DMHC-1]
MEAGETCFSHEWLLHIGASTKRNSTGSFAGYFGEGFKIASLCALRDYGWQVRMASRDWLLDVTTTRTTVDNTELESLAYSMQPRPLPHVGSELRLFPFTPKQETLFQCVLLSFYYRENPLFGACIWESDEAAIYFRSRMPKPDEFPYTDDLNGPGIVYAGFQALGSLNYPLVVCLHHHRFEDRERNNLYVWDVIDIMNRLVRYLPASSAAKVLELMKNIWYSYPKRHYDMRSWHNVIERLARGVASSAEERQAWRDAHPNLIVAKKVRTSNRLAANRRRQAMDWIKDSKRSFRLVQEGFLVLGYPELETLCEEAGGFLVNRPADSRELAYIQILESTIKVVFAEFIPDLNHLPPCLIIHNNTATWQGAANCHRLKQPKPTASGYMVRFDLSHIELQRTLFRPGLFSLALSTYLHELAHAFGGDGSKTFSTVMTNMLEVALREAARLEKYGQAWGDLTHPPDS